MKSPTNFLSFSFISVDRGFVSGFVYIFSRNLPKQGVKVKTFNTILEKLKKEQMGE